MRPLLGERRTRSLAPETSPTHHRHPYTQSPGGLPGRLVTGVRVPDYPNAGVVEEDAGKPRGAVFRAVGEGLCAGVDGAADADAAAVVDRHPACAPCGREHRV